MNFNQLLKKRRSVRDYEDKAVPLEIIREMIDDSIKAPIILGYPKSILPMLERK